jgi:hypothetical protein
MEKKAIIHDYNLIANNVNTSETIDALNENIIKIKLFQKKYSGIDFDSDQKLIINLINHFWIKYYAKKSSLIYNCK